jgi:hypothetical protein
MRLENFAKVVIRPMEGRCENESQRYDALTEGLCCQKKISTAPTRSRLDQRAISGFWATLGQVKRGCSFEGISVKTLPPGLEAYSRQSIGKSQIFVGSRVNRIRMWPGIHSLGGLKIS